MKILGIDTSTRFLCLVVCDGKKIYEYTLESGVRLSTLLVPTIERVLESLGWTAKDIDYFACGLGPGSFTGVRIGMAAIKGLSWALEKPIAGVATLDILAGNITASSISEGFVVPMVDAKRGLTYSAIYKLEKGKTRRISAYMLLSLQECLGKIKGALSGKKGNVVFLGDGLSLYKEQIPLAIKEAVILDKDYWYPKPRQLLILAREIIEKKKLTDTFKVEPIYLYPKECQIRSKSK